jgi:hypothetical protein
MVYGPFKSCTLIEAVIFVTLNFSTFLPIIKLACIVHYVLVVKFRLQINSIKAKN